MSVCRLSVCLSPCRTARLSAGLIQVPGFTWWQGPGRVPLSNLDRQQGPDDPQAGKQAQQFFDRLAAIAGRAGVALDVVAVGQAAVNLPLLGPLAHKTGGLVSVHQRELLTVEPSEFCFSAEQSNRRSNKPRPPRSIRFHAANFQLSCQTQSYWLRGLLLNYGCISTLA